MDILAALKQEEAKFEKEMDAARQQLDTVRAAIKLFGGTSSGGAKTGHADINGSDYVQFWTDTISAQRYRLAMKLLNIVPALIVVFVVAVLSLKRGIIFVP